MPVDWKIAENNERLLACLFLSVEESGGKLNYKRIAQLFGQGTTGNAIDCNFRKIRAAAKAIKKELEEGTIQPAAPSTPRKSNMPKKDSLSSVKSGRIEKPMTPSKKYGATVKAEDTPTPPSDAAYIGKAHLHGTYNAETSGLTAEDDFYEEV